MLSSRHRRLCGPGKGFIRDFIRELKSVSGDFGVLWISHGTEEITSHGVIHLRRHLTDAQLGQRMSLPLLLLLAGGLGHDARQLFRVHTDRGRGRSLPARSPPVAQVFVKEVRRVAHGGSRHVPRDGRIPRRDRGLRRRRLVLAHEHPDREVLGERRRGGGGRIAVAGHGRRRHALAVARQAHGRGGGGRRREGRRGGQRRGCGRRRGRRSCRSRRRRGRCGCRLKLLLQVAHFARRRGRSTCGRTHR